MENHTQNSLNLTPFERTTEELTSYTPKQNTYNNYSDVLTPRKKSIVFFSNSIPKNLKWKTSMQLSEADEFILSLFLVQKQYNSAIT